MWARYRQVGLTELGNLVGMDMLDRMACSSMTLTLIWSSLLDRMGKQGEITWGRISNCPPGKMIYLKGLAALLAHRQHKVKHALEETASFISL